MDGNTIASTFIPASIHNSTKVIRYYRLFYIFAISLYISLYLQNWWFRLFSSPPFISPVLLSTQVNYKPWGSCRALFRLTQHAPIVDNQKPIIIPAPLALQHRAPAAPILLNIRPTSIIYLSGFCTGSYKSPFTTSHCDGPLYTTVSLCILRSKHANAAHATGNSFLWHSRFSHRSSVPPIAAESI